MPQPVNISRLMNDINVSDKFAIVQSDDDEDDDDGLSE